MGASRIALSGQSMLCCVFACNYFAHHHFLDQRFVSEESSRFLLGGILIAVLTLLEG